MRIQFEIESIFEITLRQQVYVLAKLLNDDIDFELTDKSTLGEVPIEKWLDIPRAQDENGNQRLDLFAFALRNKNQKEELNIGQIVELIP